MFKWIVENAGTIVVSLLMIGLVALIVLRLRKDKRQRNSSCCGNCGCCPMASSCHKQS